MIPMPVTKTRRTVTVGGLEWRSDSEGVTVEGHAATFAQPYDMGWYAEQVVRGAFTKTLSESPDVRLLINHEGLPLARTRSRTLEISQDDSGLYTRAILDPSDPDVQRIVPKMQRGDLNEMSFAFGVVRQEWSEDYTQRSLTELSLAGGDVSVVTYPANPNASIALRMRTLSSEDPEKLRALYRDLAEERAGKTLSSGTTSKLTDVLESLCAIDEATDDAIETLAGLLGVPVPADDDAEDMPEMQQNSGTPARLVRARIALALLRH